MQDYANLAAEMARGLTLDRLRENRHDQLALAKALENIGEAANYLSDGFTAAHPEIPWHDIINLRHRIAHDYRNI
ncbi:MAG TPA: HepT-like ribonuclease domain-containing protein, partial [Longimicrobium sp.]|nr:HepT-like ribonuclease domain-containing protein [Longimicrobium sp.]